MAEQFANVALPSPEIDVGDSAMHPGPVADSMSAGTGTLALPESLNAIQGAMAMSTWAVPHIDPWIEVLPARS